MSDDKLTLCSEKRLRELLSVERELEAARAVIEAARNYMRDINDTDSSNDYYEQMGDALAEFDAIAGGKP